MSFKNLIAAGALALLPVSAFAAPIEFVDGGTTVVAGGTVTGAFSVDGAAGDYTHSFDLGNVGSGSARVTINGVTASAFSNLTLAWNTATIAITDAFGNLLNPSFTGGEECEGPTDPFCQDQTVVFGGPLASGVNTFMVTWSSESDLDFDGTIRVSVVPLPAGVLLLGTALAGFGIARRRKAAA